MGAPAMPTIKARAAGMSILTIGGSIFGLYYGVIPQVLLTACYCLLCGGHKLPDVIEPAVLR